MAVELGLSQKEATKYYIEYRRLKRLYKLYSIYKELKDNLFVLLYRLLKEQIATDKIEWFVHMEDIGTYKIAGTWTVDLKHRKIRVNTISPGPIDTPIFDSIAQTEEEINQIKANLVAAVPMGRMGAPDEIAKAVSFLASDDSRLYHRYRAMCRWRYGTNLKIFIFPCLIRGDAWISEDGKI